MEEKNNNLPPGFRFHPTDEELINYYLTSKVSDANGFTCKAIAVVDLNKSEPWDLPAKASMGDKVWYFFSLRDRKYPTGLRTNRATESGYWKTTGKDKHIFHGGALVGFKKTLVFYQGRAPRGLKSNWVMHEYRLHNMPHFAPSKEEWVVCRVLQKSTSTAKKHQEMTSPSQVSLDSPCDATSSMVNELANFTSLTNSSAGFMNNNIIPPTNHNINIGDHSDINTNMNLSRNWLSSSAAAEQVPSLVPWPASASRGLMLNPNLSVNSLLLKALQLKNINDPFVASSYMSQAAISNNLGGTHDHVSASPQPDQPFNLDSVW